MHSVVSELSKLVALVTWPTAVEMLAKMNWVRSGTFLTVVSR